MKRIVITGPTASGKGALAVELARMLGGEIISVDSMKIFRGMDIGTAKPSRELRREIPYHLIDIVDPWDDFSIGSYLPLVLDRVREIEERGREVVFQGGTALYLKALMDGFFEGPAADWSLRGELAEEAQRRGLAALHADLLSADPDVARTIHPNDRRRIIRALEVIRMTGKRISECWQDSSMRLAPDSYRLFAVSRERGELYRRIDRRVETMVGAGLFSEVRGLVADPRGLSRCASRCIGYRQAIEGFDEGFPESRIVEHIQRDTRRLAKQQFTWFRRFPIEWLPPDEPRKVAETLLESLR